MSADKIGTQEFRDEVLDWMELRSKPEVFAAVAAHDARIASEAAEGALREAAAFFEDARRNGWKEHADPEGWLRRRHEAIRKAGPS